MSLLSFFETIFSSFCIWFVPPPSPLSHSLSAPLMKTLLTTLKSQQTKPWTMGINPHQQITDSSMASFPEICNTLHMGAKCVPDAWGSCVVQAVLSAPRDLCYVIKNCDFSYVFPNMGDIFITDCLCLYISINFPIKIRGKLVIVLARPCWLIRCIDQILSEKMKGRPNRISWNTVDFYV